MMTKPAPSAELLVVIWQASGQQWIEMWPMSQDAKLFVAENAPKFGKLFEYELPWKLFVYPVFNFQEVVDYFNSYND